MEAGINSRVVGRCWPECVGCCLRTPGILVTSTAHVLNVEGLNRVLMESCSKREVGLATNMSAIELSCLIVLLRLGWDLGKGGCVKSRMHKPLFLSSDLLKPCGLNQSSIV